MNTDKHDEIAADADDAADKLDREAGQAARKQHNCRVYSRGFEFLSLDSNGERDENVVDYCERKDMDGKMIAEQIADVRQSGSAYLAIGYGVDAAETQEYYDAGDYEPMFDWVDLDNIDVR
jgi:CRISPR/Cas system-associated protein Cas7 (RAMP superfamily)